MQDMVAHATARQRELEEREVNACVRRLVYVYPFLHVKRQRRVLAACTAGKDINDSENFFVDWVVQSLCPV